ncbi:T9SS-dependent choice-of-anchor J family protein [Winogradskyella sp. SM1960]|uniref:T9SS-dependent choice-of-anchor J family protein n=1 Tax=Winogradskyella sp. SM1960 TaxID=2865955 RepID=UPI001CD59D7D|nr:choice-of-anchor J domain-containing protein [Winogradskyella sp. SM1960]
MKKITLLIIATLAFSFTHAQYLSEDFEAGVPPAGWIDEVGATNGTGTDVWEQTTEQSVSGANSAYFNDGGAGDRWLISPVIDLSGATAPELTYFDHVNWRSFGDTHDVLYSTDYVGSGDPEVATWTLINGVLGTEDTWVENGPYALPTNATVYIAFHYIGDNAADWYLDDVLVAEAPTCYAAEIDSAVAVDDCDNSQFSILVDVTDLGSSVNLEITNDAGVASTTVTATGEVTVGPFPTGTPVVLTLENENEDTCDVVLDAVLDFCPSAANTLDYYNLQWPATLTFAETEAADQMVYAQAYEAGLTDTTVGEAAAGIDVWIGYSTTDTDPSTEDWTWEVATFEAEVGNNDEYAVNMVDLGLSEGTYYYASRFSLNAGPYMYGGILADGSNGGAWDGTTNISGVLTVTAPLPPANDDFANAIAIVCGDTVSGDTTYATMDEGDATVDITTNADIDSPNVWYSFMGTGDIVTVSTCMNTDFDTELFVFTGTSGSLVAVAAGYDECGASWDFEAETTFTSVAGTQYYIAVEGYNLTSTGTFELAITCEAPPTCTNATATYSVVSDCETSGGFNIEVDITDMGTATDITISDDQGSDAQAATEATTLTFGPYVNGTEVVITILDDDDATCEQSSDILTQVTCPPANDECSGAEALTIGATVAGSTIGATGAASSSCDGTIGNDVWYTVTGDGGDITITLDAATVDQQIGVFESVDCAGITLGSCLVSADGFTNPSSVTFTSTAGTNYYIQAGAWSSSSGDSDFSITIETTLSTNDFETEAAFSYYPNPVKNTLSLNAQNTIEQVAMYNMLGQEVLRATPNTVDSDLDMSHLQNGTYFVKVTIANVTKTIRVIKQ